MNLVDAQRLANPALANTTAKRSGRPGVPRGTTTAAPFGTAHVSKSARYNARLVREEPSCDRWRFPACQACAFPDPLAGDELPLSPSEREAWANEPQTRDRHVAGLQEVCAAASTHTPPDPQGDGVRICGEGRYWPMIVVAVKMHRASGCPLPVQVWHNSALGPIGHELDNLPGVVLIDAAAVRKTHKARILRGWEIKTFAILHSGFRRVLFLDGDAYCVTDPRPLFALLGEAPFVFWEDMGNTWDNVKWPFYGCDGSHIPPVQGGQLLIDVGAAWRVLLIANWINQHSDYFYVHQFGDQDSWRVALAGTGERYKLIGIADWENVAFTCRHEQRPYIVHRCQAKLYRGEQVAIDPSLPGESRVMEIFGQITGVNLAMPAESEEQRKERLRNERRQFLGLPA